MRSIGTLVIMICLVGCTAERRFDYTEIIMGVDARIVVYAENEDQARSSARAAFDRLRDLDRTLSDYRPDSELNSISDRAGLGSQPASDDVRRVLTRAQAVAGASGGAFDVTVGPVVQLWRAARREGRIPDPGLLSAAAALVDTSRLHVDDAAGTVTLDHVGMRLDVGGIGKGYGIDAAYEVLQSKGHASCLVDLGGDLRVGSAPPQRSGWRVRLGDTVAVLTDVAVAASGDAEQHVDIDGVRHSHIIDPRTGQALRDGPTVTVIANDATTADAFASAISVLGEREGLALALHTPGVDARIDGRSGQAATPGFPR